MTTTAFDTFFDKHTQFLKEIAHDPSWDGSRFEIWRKTEKTNLGNTGEALVTDVITHMFKMFYGDSVNIVCDVTATRRGDYDVSLTVGDKSFYFEVKTATQGSWDKKANKPRNNFQFNSIKKNCQYDFVFCLGVAPNDMFFKVKTKQWAVDTLTTCMSKKVDGAYKHSTTLNTLFKLTPENLQSAFMDLGIIDKQD